MDSQILVITPNRNKKPLTALQGVLENLSSKLLCNVIFSSLPGQSNIPCFTMNHINKLTRLTLAAKIWIHTWLNENNSYYIPRSSRKGKCGFSLLRRFRLVIPPIWHFFICDAQFVTSSLDLGAKLCKSHQIETKNCSLHPKVYWKNLLA